MNVIAGKRALLSMQGEQAIRKRRLAVAYRGHQVAGRFELALDVAPLPG
jgi:hypothetical protein